jgi:adenylate cyclase
VPAILKVTIDGEDRQFPCGPLVTIGRSKNNDVNLPDPKVSRGHAIIRCLGDGEYYLIDLGSSNGTLVNEKRVFVPLALKDTDTIRLGSHQLVFQTDTPVFAPDDSDDSVCTNPTMLTTSRSVQEIALLVADVRRYTTLSEQIPVDFLARVMARWFEKVNQIVEQNHGVIDKYIGDAVMVRWTSDKARRIADGVAAALRTASAMNEALTTLNAEFPELPFPLKIGIGINSGQAVLGNVGGGNRREYTVLGDAVNLAFRLETASKALEKDVVIASECCQPLTATEWTRHMTTVAVKGKKDPVNVYAISFDQLATLLPPTPPAQG